MANLKDRLARGETLIGTFSQIPSAGVVELIGYLGFDYVIIDTEHGITGPYGPELEGLIRGARAGGVSSLVRVTANDEAMILKALDFGADGVVVPRVRDRAGAERAARACRYNPLGTRGACPPVRAARYGTTDWLTHWERWNEDVFCGVIVEDPEALDHVDEIASVDGVDLLFFGPFDLAVGMSARVGEVSQETVIEKYLDSVVQASRRHNVPVAGLAWDAPGARRLVDAGCQILAVTVDMVVLRTAYETLLDGIRKEVGRGKR
jgi:4-hydroxy-2-oxoheptanedioate aldolase